MVEKNQKKKECRERRATWKFNPITRVVDGKYYSNKNDVKLSKEDEQMIDDYYDGVYGEEDFN